MLLRRAHDTLRAKRHDRGRNVRHNVRVRVVLDRSRRAARACGLRQGECVAPSAAREHHQHQRRKQQNINACSLHNLTSKEPTAQSRARDFKSHAAPVPDCTPIRPLRVQPQCQRLTKLLHGEYNFPRRRCKSLRRTALRPRQSRHNCKSATRDIARRRNTCARLRAHRRLGLSLR